MAPMPWTINSEIYPMWARGVCYSMATSVNWLFNMIISLTFLTLTEALTTHGTFYMYSIIASIGWLLLFWKLPETRGRSLEEVSSLFARQKSDNEEIMEDGSDQGGSQSSQGGTVIRSTKSALNVVGMDNLGFNGDESSRVQQSRSFKIQSPLSKVATHAMRTGAIPKLNSNSDNGEDDITIVSKKNNNNDNSQSGSPQLNYQGRRYSNGRHPQAYIASTLSTSPDGASKNTKVSCLSDGDSVVAYMHRRKTTNNRCNNKQTINITKSFPLPQQHYIPTTISTSAPTKLTNDKNKITTPIITNTNSINDERSSSLSHLINYNDYYSNLDDTDLCNDDLREDYEGQLFVMNSDTSKPSTMSSSEHFSNPRKQLYGPYLGSRQQQQQKQKQKQHDLQLQTTNQLNDDLYHTNNSPPKTLSPDKITTTTTSYTSQHYNKNNHSPQPRPHQKTPSSNVKNDHLSSPSSSSLSNQR